MLNDGKRKKPSSGSPCVISETYKVQTVIDEPFTEIQVGDLYFCQEQRLVCVGGQVIELTAKEFDILALLITHPKRVFTYELIMELVWNEDYSYYSRKAVNNHVSNLRKKLKVTPDSPDYIKSVVGVGYKFYNGTDALKCIESTPLDLAILDIMLSDIDGLQICQKIREKFYFPVIMLTAKALDGDKIMGLSIADDYITKPFNPLEVVARVKAQLRQYMRYRQPHPEQEDERSEYDIRGMTISKNSHKCILFGKELGLTPTEFSIYSGCLSVYLKR